MSVQAKDVSMGRRPLSEFTDPRLDKNLNSVDFESILQVAVLCAARSSKGRPTIDVVFDEMDKAWKNTNADRVSYTSLLLLFLFPFFHNFSVINQVLNSNVLNDFIQCLFLFFISYNSRIRVIFESVEVSF